MREGSERLWQRPARWKPGSRRRLRATRGFLIALMLGHSLACDKPAESDGGEAECTSGLDCPPSSICRAGLCLAYQCEEPVTEGDQGILSGEGGCFCDEQVACPEGQRCDQVFERCVPLECTPARPCRLGFFCQEGV